MQYTDHGFFKAVLVFTLLAPKCVLSMPVPMASKDVADITTIGITARNADALTLKAEPALDRANIEGRAVLKTKRPGNILNASASKGVSGLPQPSRRDVEARAILKTTKPGHILNAGASKAVGGLPEPG